MIIVIVIFTVTFLHVGDHLLLINSSEDTNDVDATVSCMGFPPRENCRYTSCYCEENVYQLCDSLPDEVMQRYFVVFISNDKRAAPLFAQRACRERPYVVWDYHVVLLEKGEEGTKVWDLDSTLSFPCLFNQYWQSTFQPIGWNIAEEFKRKFRVVPSSFYLSHFSSDRSHMKKPDGSWIAPPPVWDLIYKRHLHNNIDQFISMNPLQLGEISEVFSENEMYAKYSAQHLD